MRFAGRCSLRSGAAPVQLSSDDRFLHVNYETDSEVSVFAVAGARLTEIQTISTLPSDTSVTNSTAEILIDRADRYLYVSNRGHDSIAVFSIDAVSGKLSLRDNVQSGGKTPRNIRLDPTEPL